MRILNINRTICVLSFSFIWFNTKCQTSLVWGRQIGSDKDEYVMNQDIDMQGNIYISGKTTGNMESKNFGKNDGFITKIDSLGNTIWLHQFGTPQEEDIRWSAYDHNGNIYITGSTTGNLQGINSGKEDIFIIKYNIDGQILWIRQFGTDSTETGQAVYVDKENFVFITGSTHGKLGKELLGNSDGFLMKMDPEGNLIWIQQFGTAVDDDCFSVTGNSKSIYVCGTTWGDLSGKNKGVIDGFTLQFNIEGDPVKINQFGSDGFDIGMTLKVDDESNIYVGGTTSGNLGGQQLGNGDCFLMKISASGEILWKNQFGTINHDGVRNIAFNSVIPDQVLICGLLNLPPAKAFIRMYKKDGNLVWEKSIPESSDNKDASGKDASFDGKGNIYHVGLTKSGLFGNQTGGDDVYLIKLKMSK